MNETHRFSVSVAAAVVRADGKVLAIQRRDNDHWEPPGGVLEHGEEILDGLVREVKEETGYTVKPGPLTGIYQNMQRDIFSLVFRCDASGGQTRLSDESKRVEWLEPDEVTNLMSEAYAVRLLDAIGNGIPPRIRTHDGSVVLQQGVTGISGPDS